MIESTLLKKKKLSTSHLPAIAPGRVYGFKRNKWVVFCPLFLMLPCSKDDGGAKVIAIDLMINEEIRDREVRVISQTGEQIGVMPLNQAMQLAEEAQLDLVKIAPQSKPPVCKIMDYGKYRFELAKKEKESKKNQKVVSLKEIRLSTTIDDHDMQVKARNCEKFLKSGDKVKVSLRFKGRQISHSQLGLNVLQEFHKLVEPYCVMDKQPKMEGRSMTMILSPKK